MPVLMTTPDFIKECAERRVDYARLFEPRVTPAWLLKFEEQVLNECRKELAEIDLPTAAEFEHRVAIMDAEQADEIHQRNSHAPEPLRTIINSISPGVPA